MADIVFVCPQCSKTISVAEYCAGETNFERHKRLERETLTSIVSFRGRDRLGRSEVHQRHAVR